MIGTIYPVSYDIAQVIRVGPADYFRDFWNLIDFVYMFASIAQVILHTLYSPFEPQCKATMTVVLFLGMGKTFFFLRIFESFSPIVTMLSFVIKDLLPFTIIYAILCLMFAMQFAIMGLGNKRVKGKFRDTYANEESDKDFGVVNSEYNQIPQIIGNTLTIFRISMGDYAIIPASNYLDVENNILFWIMFGLILFLTNIIFLNFVIAEAGNSYNVVAESLVQY